MAITVTLMELTAYDIGGAASVTLRYSSPVGFITGPSETPASTYYDPRLLTPMPVKRDLFEAGATSGHATIDLGFVELQNADGALDALLTYGYGRRLVLRRGVVGAAYPSAFATIYDGTALSVEATGTKLTVKLRSLQLDLEQPFQSTKYDGDNVPPDGLEGNADDLLGKPKPVCYGSVLNISPPCVNPQKLVYQVNDGAVTSIDGVYDAGNPLGDNLGLFFDTGGGFNFSGVSARSIAYGLQQTGAAALVAVGDSGSMGSSSTGTSWNDFSSSNDLGGSNIFAAAFGSVLTLGDANVIVAGASGKLYTYTGINLTAGQGTSRTSQFGATSIRGLLYVPGIHLWIAVGDSGKISTSADGGQTWTARTSGVATALYGVMYKGARLVAFGAAGVTLFSDDYGVTWATSTSGFGATDIYAGAVGRGDMVVCGGANKTAFSQDGVNWSLNTFTGTGATIVLRAAVYTAGKYLLLGEDGAALVSSDGQSFSQLGGPGVTASTDDFLSAANWNDQHVYACGTDGTDGIVYRSTGPTAYANAADLEDDTLAPVAGSYGYYLGGGYIRLGSPPFGQVTADVSQGANAAARTQAQLAALVLTRAGKSAGTAVGNYLSADLTALDSADSSVRGIWINEETTYADVLDELMAPGSAWYLDRQGRYRLVQFTAPTGSSTFMITANDIRKDGLVRVTLAKDDVSNVPTWRTKVRYAKNYTVQTSGLAGAVSDDRRAFLAQEYREAIDDDTAVQTPHPLAVESIYPSTIQTAASAATEAARLQTLRGTLRHCFDVTVPLASYSTVDLNDVGTLQHDRYGLSAGVLHRVIGVHPDAAGEWVTLRLWR